MHTLHERLPGANAPDPPAVPPTLSDPAAQQAWLTFLREHVLDVFAIAGDAVKPRKKRMFSRHEAERRLAEEERIITASLEAAFRALSAPEAPPGA